MEFLLAITACCLGFLVAWFARSRRLSAWQAAAADSERQLTADKAEALRQLSIASETLRLRTEEAQSLRDSLDEQTRLAADRAVEAAALRTANANLLEQLEHRKQETETCCERRITWTICDRERRFILVCVRIKPNHAGRLRSPQRMEKESPPRNLLPTPRIPGCTTWETGVFGKG